MAVLKSPKNIKHKSRWVSRYNQKLSKTLSSNRTQDTGNIKRFHKHATFLNNMSYHEDKSLDQPSPRRGVFSTRLPLKIHCGRKSFDLESLNPVSLTSEFRRLAFRKRYALFISANWLKFDPEEVAKELNFIFSDERPKRKRPRRKPAPKPESAE